LIDLRDKDTPTLRHLASLVEAIRTHATEAQFMLVGAAARDLLLEHWRGIAPPRRTTDVDLAFCVSGWPTFERLKTDLIGSGLFTEGSSTHRLQYNPIGTLLDLIPFGGVESALGEIAWPPYDNPVMSVIGYDAALRSGRSPL
jgi:predicted nucleotidyltransferase